MKFSIKDLFSKCDQIRIFLRIWSHLLKKYLMENFIFCVVEFFILFFLIFEFRSYVTIFYSKVFELRKANYDVTI